MPLVVKENLETDIFFSWKYINRLENKKSIDFFFTKKHISVNLVLFSIDVFP